MSHYVDGYVVPVKRDRLEEYRRMAEGFGAMWMEFGALSYWECVADDVKPGEVTSFPQAVQLQDDEIVILSWTVFRSREDRDRANQKVMDDPRVKDLVGDKAKWPFDGKRMFFGGFRTIVELDEKP
ncbi:MAG TPA: DUF1428 domain-containing protein [Casimicrobiaceae bacterium]|jgi:uncharacterized protein YbaA (DUF1428 family)